LVVGKLKQWAEYAKVEPIRIPGYWIHKTGTVFRMGARPQPGEKVVLALHGGAYIRLSAHPYDPPAEIARSLLKHVVSVQRVFAPEYRLSSAEPFGAAHPFPTALLDALAGYLYLVNGVGFSPSDVIIEGDSAGGNLATALTRYLTEYIGTPGLPAPPCALLLLSPWADLSNSHNRIPGGSATTFVESDVLGNPDETLEYPLLAFTGPHGIDAAQTNPYISPASLHPDLVVDFKKFPRAFLVAGGAEVLLDQIHTLRDRMVKDMGEGNGVMQDEGRLQYHEPRDAVHAYLMFSWHEPEVTKTLKAIAEWISLGT
jgi:acetyl esterase/lipase